jgi:putative GTP pyrophosphokinase
MPESQTRRFRDTYKRYREEVLDPTRDAIKAELKTWKRGRRWQPHRAGDLTVPVPVQRTRVRVKRLESVEDKIGRNPEKYPGGLTEENLRRVTDLIGARIILYFVTDIPLIDRELHRSPEIEISKEVPPRAYLPRDLADQLGITEMDRQDKSSGYASVHYRCQLAPHVGGGASFELQVRTLAEDVWGEIEHILGYKPGKHTALQVRREFQILSKQLGAIDEQFALLYDRQRKHREQITIQPEHSPNAENLPRVLNEMGLTVRQNELQGLLKVLASRGIDTVGELELRGTQDRMHLISKTWQEELHRVPDTFDVIAVLGTLPRDADPDQVRAKTIEWAAVAQEWSKRTQRDRAAQADAADLGDSV